MKTSGLRLGEKILFGIAAAFVLFAAISFVAMEIHRVHSGKKMYATTSHFDFSPEGLNGSARFRDLGCTSCHRAVRNGTNNGVNLDGIGSRHKLVDVVDTSLPAHAVELLGKRRRKKV